MLLFLHIFIIACTSKSGKKPSFLKEGSTITGKVIAIIDGDTYDALLLSNKTIRLSMEGIDAPEKGMPFYQKSKKYLTDLCFVKQVKLKLLA